MSIFSGWYGKVASKLGRLFDRYVICRLGGHEYPKAGNLGDICTRCGAKIKERA